MPHTEWFNQARYGMFIHWGAYSAGGRGEWVRNRECIPTSEYKRDFVDKFSAAKYDPAAWAKMARKWGMGYMVLTARHHDGFALWNSRVNPFNSVKFGPKRDLVRTYVEAVRAEGLKVGLYYSPANWGHPDYPDAYSRDWPVDSDWRSEAARKRFVTYYRAELRELLGNYGSIDYIWFDGCIPGPLDGDETIAKIVRKLQPGAIINNRLGQPFDVKTCEQAIVPPKADIDWEACITLNNNWGYTKNDDNWKKPADVIGMLANCAGKGGNLLLNVGPEESGDIPQPSVEVLDAVGKWLKANRKCLENCEPHAFSWFNGSRFLISGNHFYVIFQQDPGSEWNFADLATPVLSAHWLDTGEAVAFKEQRVATSVKRITFTGLKHSLCRVLVVECDGTPEPRVPQSTFWVPG